ncbi:cytochrome P450 [Paraphoma chrysanthemicola]|uniref:Cytochrome P450 n=1 Tax=Paraphoma chrysanthemicola TaxID=798071 RepID=A0A8K0RLT1_9PLEO|nr:cytochrome P450 [Paraphoma chrysanthemicola]
MGLVMPQSSTAQCGTETLALLASFIGLASHAWVKKHEPTLFGFLAWLLLLTGFFLYCSNVGVDRFNLSSIRVMPMMIAMSFYIVVLSASIATYRLFINPLRKFPGDTMAGLTKWHGFWIAHKGMTHHSLLRKHQQYGDYIRVGPNEISITDPKYIPMIHGNKSKFPKGPWYEHMLPDQPPSLIAILPYDEHKSRRKVWDEVLTPKALRVYEKRINSLINDLQDVFAEFAKNGEAFDLALWTEHLLFDAIGKIAFNVEFHSIRDRTPHFYVDFIHQALKFVASFANVSWIKPLLAKLPLDRKQLEDVKRFQAFGNENLMERIQKEGSSEIDALGFLLRAAERNPAYKLSVPELASETGLIIAAGSDTTSIAITSAMYWLLTHKEAYYKLRDECENLWGPSESVEWAKLGDTKRAPYLNACVSEALRLLPPGPNGMQRVVNTKGGITVNDIYVPEGTKINVHPWTIHHDSRLFEKPWDFIPERWIPGSSFKGTHTPDAYIPFALGAYSCIGKPLALLQIRMYLVSMVTKFDFEIAPGFDKRNFIENTQAFFGLTKLPLPVRCTITSKTEGTDYLGTKT